MSTAPQRIARLADPRAVRDDYLRELKAQKAKAAKKETRHARKNRRP